ncbi:helix-turn-helix domain-containing protein [uncultured Kordia sp.]|uniref:helix-turn-helix domain-containing protein n=1 Tax=uncultured Kordia sp. TaxID=507699 RepID=UPI00263240D4|nr:helix-turn-helix domain-containing protein [uncultured Kordia sp.]
MKELNQITRLMVFVLIFFNPDVCVFGHNLDNPNHQTEFTKLSNATSKEFPYSNDEANLKESTSLIDSIPIYKELAIQHAQNHEVEKASFYTDKYIKTSYDFNFIHDSEFVALQHAAPFEKIAKKYCLNFSKFNLLYLFSALIGFFIAILMNFKRNKNKTAIMFMSAFIFIHSFFTLHLFLHKSNFNYRYPHVLFMSTIFSYMYGPLIYFYFKSITSKYVFRKKHLLHLIPTIVVIVFLMPLLTLPGEEKLKIALGTSTVVYESFLKPLFVVKLTSLIIYVCVAVNIYMKKIRKKPKISQRVKRWQRNLVILICAYILFYSIYGLMVVKVIPRENNHEFLYHIQILVMISTMLYIGYMAYVQPKIITNSYIKKVYSKYKNSGLTKSLSYELKEQLLYLLNDQKIYKMNDINLERLSKMLNTTRHNTSQVINEHFQLNFFELINQYRIMEASQILRNDIHHNLNIIDVAYEVGFNNKVTFNKSFKKHFAQTPSQYLKSVRVA